MKYIRTKNGKIGKVISVSAYNGPCPEHFFVKFKNDTEIYGDYQLNIIKQADTIEELCDEMVVKYKNEEKPRIINMNALLKSCGTINIAFKKHIKWLFDNYKNQLEFCVLSIWVDETLKPVAKMNEKGELELL